MAEIHSADLYGSLAAAGNEGLVNQRLKSNGPGVQVSWQTPTIVTSWVGNTLSITQDGVLGTQVMSLVSADAGNIAIAGTDGRVFVPADTVRKFAFASASALVHTITHNLGLAFPNVNVYNSVSLAQIVPSSIVATSTNVITITLAVARAIAGEVLG